MLAEPRRSQDADRLDRARRRLGGPSGGNPLDRPGPRVPLAQRAGRLAARLPRRACDGKPVTLVTPGDVRRDPHRWPSTRDGDWLYFQAVARRTDPADTSSESSSTARASSASPPRTSRGRTTIRSRPTPMGDPSVFGVPTHHRPSTWSACPVTSASGPLTENAGLKKKFAAIKKRPTEFFRVDIGDGVALDGWCMLPPDFDPAKTYPLLVHVYGEPAGPDRARRLGRG